MILLFEEWYINFFEIIIPKGEFTDIIKFPNKYKLFLFGTLFVLVY